MEVLELWPADEDELCSAPQVEELELWVALLTVLLPVDEECSPQPVVVAQVADAVETTVVVTVTP